MVRRRLEKTIAFAIRSVDPVLTKEGLGEVVVVGWVSPSALPNLQGLKPLTLRLSLRIIRSCKISINQTNSESAINII